MKHLFVLSSVSEIVHDKLPRENIPVNIIMCQGISKDIDYVKGGNCPVDTTKPYPCIRFIGTDICWRYYKHTDRDKDFNKLLEYLNPHKL